MNSTQDLETRLHGTLIRPGDAAYDDARAVWNGMIDRRPALIVRCADADDVAAAIAYARQHGMPLSVRGGGHNVAGSAVSADGVVVDLSQMKDVQVDFSHRRVRAQGGATIGDVDRAAQAAGLAVPLGLVSETGIAGLTLSGGIGWLRRAYGTSSDNLVAAEVVTAAGERLHVSETENPELLWGLRGGGGGLGVVTSFEYHAYPVGPDVSFALVFHPWQDAKAAMRNFREWASTAPDEVSAFAILWHAPMLDEIPAEYHHKPVVTYAAVHLGDSAEARHDLAPLRDFGQPIADLSDVVPYLDVQQAFDDDYPAHEKRYYWKSQYLTRLDDDVLDVLAAINEASPSPHSTLDIWQLGGAFSRMGAEETAFGNHSAPYLLGVEANWENPDDDEVNVQWARDAHQAMSAYSTGAEYLNFPGFYEGGEQILRSALGANYERVMGLRKQHDPTGLFSRR
jgi:FAD/FMN-containing dehydrogenase